MSNSVSRVKAYMKSNTFLAEVFFVAFFCAIPLAGLAQSSQSAEESVKAELAGRHFSEQRENLEQLAGGREELVAILLTLRTSEDPPFVGIRAEKLLLHYADDPRVAEALADDVSSVERTGLARAVALHLDRVPTSRVRQKLATEVVSRAGKERAFLPYANSLKKSEDPEVKRIADQGLP